MSIIGIGIDLAAIRRFEALLERHGERFVDRICRPEEVPNRKRKDLGQHLAGLFASKEAVLKALGTGWDNGLTFRQVEIVRNSSGAPKVRLHGEALTCAESLGVTNILVSITHDNGSAAAVAVLEKD